MSANPSNRYEIDIEDVEYLRHGDKPFLARIYKPRGKGPFPAVIDIHGGAWSISDRKLDAPLAEPLASNGVVVASLDFRTPIELSYPGPPSDGAGAMRFYIEQAPLVASRPALPGTVYPAQIADVNYGIRWIKAHAADYNVRADCVGALGESSGGHVAALLGMRPRDARYCAIALPPGAPAVDASLRFVVLCWPVIDPLNRYRFAKRLKESPNPPAWVDAVMQIQIKFWESEEAMSEGSPVLILERGEPVATPPALYIQATGDPVHPREDVDRFVSHYRKAGGDIDLQLYKSDYEVFTHSEPDSPETARAMASIIEFVHSHS
jgi:acetyl esterase